MFMEHLQTLRYTDKPDYDRLYASFGDLAHRLGMDEHSPYDWELQKESNSNTSSTTPLQIPTKTQQMATISADPLIVREKITRS